MRKNESLSIRVPTETLRDILKDVPDALIEIEAVAIEKVAEELAKKVNNNMQTKVEKYAQQVIDEASRKLKNVYAFPPEAKAIIDDLARKLVNEHMETAIRRARNDLEATMKGNSVIATKMMQEVIDEAYEAREASLDTKIRDMARSEFFKVLTEARAAMGDTVVPQKVVDESGVVPRNCRGRLRREGKAYPKSGCMACKSTIATGLSCPYGESNA